MKFFSRDREIIHPAKSLKGMLPVPGDKSISHRYALLATLAEGMSEIRGYSPSQDCESTLECLRKLGVTASKVGDTVKIEGRGLAGLRESRSKLDAGNSGTTMRLAAGILAGQSFRTVIKGDKSLSRRPMSRVITPLEQMGAQIKSAEDGRPPLTIQGGNLTAIRYELPVASAQVKSAVLLAGLFAEGVTQVVEPLPTRDHTEIALEQFGAEVGRHDLTIAVEGRPQLRAQTLHVPGDISSAAFLMAAALITPDSDLTLRNVGLNPTRTAMLDLLVGAGGYVKILNVEMIQGELVGDLHVRSSRLRGLTVPKDKVPSLIDEVPVLGVLGTQTEEGFTIHGAEELRVKESDRIRGVAENLRRMGAEVEEFPDGFRVPGNQKLHGAEIDSLGDHRLAMALSVAGLVAEGPEPTTILGSGSAAVSYPDFYRDLKRLVR